MSTTAVETKTETTTETTTQMEALKARLKATWMSGDYGHFAQYLEPGARQFFDRLAIEPGTHMLDVACGAGQIAIPAALAGIKVTGIDIATNLIEQARKRALQNNVEVSFDEGDAEMLPYQDASFDVVISLIGAMFAPRPERVAAELIRVCRPGGRIAMANWTPQGHVGRMFKIVGKYVPPPPLMPSPLQWGDEAIVRERLHEKISNISFAKRMYPMVYPFSPQEVVEFFFTYYGPTLKAYAALDEGGKDNLRRELEDLWITGNQARDGSTHVEAEYLEVIAVRD